MLIDKTKAIITLILAIIALVLYAARLEHRLTVIEQNRVRDQDVLETKLDNIDINQRRLMQHLFFN